MVIAAVADEDAAAVWWMDVTRIGEAKNPGPTATNDGFQKCSRFDGSHVGHVYRIGALGLGYYPDEVKKTLDFNLALRPAAEVKPVKLLLDAVVLTYSGFTEMQSKHIGKMCARGNVPRTDILDEGRAANEYTIKGRDLGNVPG